MKCLRIALIFILAVMNLALCLMAQWPAYRTADIPRNSDGKPNLEAAAPRTADGKPDLSGIWEFRGGRGGLGGRGVGGQFNIAGRGGNTNAQAPPPAQPATPPPPPADPNAPALATFFNIGAGIKDGLPFTPWAAELRKERQSANAMDNPDAHCLPLGLTQLHMHPQPRKIVQVPGLIVILYEAQGGVRQIHMDGRKLPTLHPDLDPWWYGYSIGHWEGDTLVVETNGFRDDVWLDVNGSPLTSTGKMTERIRRPNFGNLEIDVTVEDAKSYTKPWTVRINQRILVDSELIEFVCNENEKSSLHYQK